MKVLRLKSVPKTKLFLCRGRKEDLKLSYCKCKRGSTAQNSSKPWHCFPSHCCGKPSTQSAMWP